MKKIKILLVVICFLYVGCERDDIKHHHHKTDSTITVLSIFGDTVNTWDCRMNEVKYLGNRVEFIDSLDNRTYLTVYSGSVIVEKKRDR